LKRHRASLPYHRSGYREDRPDKGDKMALTLSGGRFGGYMFKGTLASGNFTYTP
jgi:hypothetical protein